MKLPVQRMYLNQNRQIDDECMKSFGEYIKSNKTIEEVSLSDSEISDVGIEILAPYLDDNTTFKRLYMFNNKRITDKSIPLLMKMIESSCIEELGVEKTSITKANTLNALLACNKIKSGCINLEFEGKQLNDDDLIKICAKMKKYGVGNLKIINLAKNKITSKGASIMVDTLKECDSVVLKLIFFENQIDDECMKQVGEFIQDNEYLEYLSVSYNQITDKGVKILSEYLIGNVTLKGLNLSANLGITDASFPYLIEVAKKSSIKDISLWITSVSLAKKKEIEEIQRLPVDQREIPIKSNTKSAAKISSAST